MTVDALKTRVAADGTFAIIANGITTWVGEVRRTEAGWVAVLLDSDRTFTAATRKAAIEGVLAHE